MILKNNFLEVKFNDDESLLLYKSYNNTLEIQGDFFGDSLHIKGHKIDISDMPLYDDSFKWTIDGYKDKD